MRVDAALVMPSKLTGMLASGRCVVATADPETQISAVLEGRGPVPPGSPELLADAVMALTAGRSLRLGEVRGRMCCNV